MGGNPHYTGLNGRREDCRAQPFYPSSFLNLCRKAYPLFFFFMASLLRKESGERRSEGREVEQADLCQIPALEPSTHAILVLHFQSSVQLIATLMSNTFPIEALSHLETTGTEQSGKPSHHPTYANTSSIILFVQSTRSIGLRRGCLYSKKVHIY